LELLGIHIVLLRATLHVPMPLRPLPDLTVTYLNLSPPSIPVPVLVSLLSLPVPDSSLPMNSVLALRALPSLLLLCLVSIPLSAQPILLQLYPLKRVLDRLVGYQKPSGLPFDAFNGSSAVGAFNSCLKPKRPGIPVIGVRAVHPQPQLRNG
jgi:hypothetical protein